MPIDREVPSARTTLLGTAIVLVAGAAAGRAQDTILSWSDPTVRFGAVTASAGDVDGDGFVDILVRNETFPNESVDLYSGRDGSLLSQITSTDIMDGFGIGMAGIGDVDGDGTPDFAIGAPWRNFAVGAVDVFSGRTAALLYTITGVSMLDELGTKILAVGDADGDQVPDFAVSWAGDTGPPRRTVGRVTLHSGRTGAKLLEFTTPSQSLVFGLEMDVVGDLDGDGVQDLVIGDPYGGPYWSSSWYTAFWFSGGRATVFSTATGTLLFELARGRKRYSGGRCSPFKSPLFGSAVAGVGDVDGDGVPDILVGAPWNTYGGACTYLGYRYSPLGEAILYSGATGAELYRVVDSMPKQPPVTVNQFGRRVAGLGDVTGDGIPDFAVGDPDFEDPVTAMSRVRVYSGTGQPLYEWTDPLAYDPAATGRYGQSLGAVDLEGDGKTELLRGVSTELSGGQASVHRGNDLYLWASPRSVPSGSAFQVQLAEGVTGRPGLLVLAAVNGAPVWIPLGLRPFDALGLVTRTFTVPASVTGTFDLVGFGVTVTGTATSAFETIQAY